MKALQNFLEEHYGITADSIELLEGYSDKTFLVRSANSRYVLKLQIPNEELLEQIRLENLLVHGFPESLAYELPLPVPNIDGRPYVAYEGKILRVLTYLEGTFLAEIAHTEDTFTSLGDMLGLLNARSMELNPGVLKGRVFSWDLQHMELHRNSITSLKDPRDKALIAYYLLQYKCEVMPNQYKLRKSLIHNDVNDWNVLTKHNRVCGLIDFGDMCYSWLISELAIALTYVLMDKEDPLSIAAEVIKAYHKRLPLEPLELELLYYLIATRMCLSLCNSAIASQKNPDSDYIQISEAPIRRLLRKWISISPDKARKVFLEAAELRPEPSINMKTYLKRRNEIFPPSLSLSYKTPIVMRRAAFQYMFDTNGTSILDAYNNIMLVGHCHPKVVQATSEILRRLNTNTRYLYDELLDYSEHLLQHFPSKLSRIFLVNSGSAATDLAVRLSRAHTRRKKILALEYGYHGNTLAGIEFSHYKHMAGGSYPDTLLCPMPKLFGGGFKDEADAAAHFSAICNGLLRSNQGEVAAFIAEPIMGCGGQVPLPEGFLPKVYEMVRLQGGICISDEVQVGFGRLGSWFWGYQKYGVEPDMVILGKPMGNGHPIGAVVTTEAIAGSFDNGPEFFSSFGGNPVSCAAGRAVLEVLESEGLQQHAKETGAYLINGFKELSSRFPCIADVRGEGLFIGIELVDADGSPATQLAQTLKNELRNVHILIGTDGPADNVLKIKPPLPFNKNNCDQLLNQSSRILGILQKSF